MNYIHELNQQASPFMAGLLVFGLGVLLVRQPGSNGAALADRDLHAKHRPAAR